MIPQQSQQSSVRTGGRGAPALYPFRNMQVGDCFEATYLDSNPFSAKACASRVGRNMGWKFSSKRTKTGVLITRVA